MQTDRSGERPHVAPGDEAPPGTRDTGEDLCPKCGGKGRIGERIRENCEGTGRIVAASAARNGAPPSVPPLD